MDWYFLATFLVLGACVGIFAGLFGIGGGGIMVPVLSYLFLKMNFPVDHIVHLALGTSMAAIVPTALASLYAHHQREAVLWSVVIKIAPGILLGTFVATFFASHLSPRPLAIFFSSFMALVALQMLIDKKPRPARRLPGALGLSGVGLGIGSVSALVAIGGGTLTVPFLMWCNITLPVAIGTSAAVGLPIAFAGAVGYLVNGFDQGNLPAHSLGFIYWPAVIAMATASFFTARFGANLAHSLPVDVLKKGFALLLTSLSLHMLFTVLSHSQ